MWLLIGSLIQLFAMHPLDLPGDSPVIATLGVRWFKGISALRQSDCQIAVCAKATDLLQAPVQSCSHYCWRRVGTCNPTFALDTVHMVHRMLPKSYI